MAKFPFRVFVTRDPNDDPVYVLSTSVKELAEELESEWQEVAEYHDAGSVKARRDVQTQKITRSGGKGGKR